MRTCATFVLMCFSSLLPFFFLSLSLNHTLILLYLILNIFSHSCFHVSLFLRSIQPITLICFTCPTYLYNQLCKSTLSFSFSLHSFRLNNSPGPSWTFSLINTQTQTQTRTPNTNARDQDLQPYFFYIVLFCVRKYLPFWGENMQHIHRVWI